MSKFVIYTDIRDTQGHVLKMARRIMALSLKRQVKVFGCIPGYSIPVIQEVIQGYVTGFGRNPVPRTWNPANVTFEQTSAYSFLDNPASHIATGPKYIMLLDLPVTRFTQAFTVSQAGQFRMYLSNRADYVE